MEEFDRHHAGVNAAALMIRPDRTTVISTDGAAQRIANHFETSGARTFVASFWAAASVLRVDAMQPNCSMQDMMESFLHHRCCVNGARVVNFLAFNP
jgi:hypothetical protein